MVNKVNFAGFMWADRPPVDPLLFPDAQGVLNEASTCGCQMRRTVAKFSHETLCLQRSLLMCTMTIARWCWLRFRISC